MRYPDGYESWSPKETFENTYLPVGDTAGPTRELVDRFMLEQTISRMDERTVLVTRGLNGFSEVHEPVFEADDRGCGKTVMAYDQARERFFRHLSFLFAWAKNGIRHSRY